MNSQWAAVSMESVAQAQAALLYSIALLRLHLYTNIFYICYLLQNLPIRGRGDEGRVNTAGTHDLVLQRILNADARAARLHVVRTALRSIAALFYVIDKPAPDQAGGRAPRERRERINTTPGTRNEWQRE